MSVKIETAPSAAVSSPAAPADTRMATLRAIYIIWYRDILRYWRDRWRLVASLAQPLLFLGDRSPGTIAAMTRMPFVGLCVRTFRTALDVDRDGFSGVLGGGDCAPFDPAVNPGAEEIPGQHDFSSAREAAENPSVT